MLVFLGHIGAFLASCGKILFVLMIILMLLLLLNSLIESDFGHGRAELRQGILVARQHALLLVQKIKGSLLALVREKDGCGVSLN